MLLGQIHQLFQGNALRSLDGKPNGPGPNVLSHDPKRSGHGKHHCVEVLLLEVVEIHELATVRIDVGVRVLYLSLLQKHWRNGVIASIHQLEQGIVGAMSQRKLSFEHVAWIGVPQNRMAKARDHLPLLQGLFSKLREQLLCGPLITQLLLHI